MKKFESLGLKHDGKRLLVLDQTKLPHVEEWIDAESPEIMVEIIRELKTRGAPLIGVAAATSLAKFAESGPDLKTFLNKAQLLRASRPTAVNLMNAIDRVIASVEKKFDAEAVIKIAEEIFDEDVALCEGMAENGARLINDGEGILTHCNTGGLATVGCGTALGVIAKAWQQKKKVHVYVDETRPLLQGGRLTTWELEKLKIPYTLICDNMAAVLMREKRIQRVFVGSDRVAMNGDFANKIGTYSVAVNAKHHGIDFHPVAPRTTIDPQCKNGSQIEIENRKPAEVRGAVGSFGQVTWAPANCDVFNPSFDVTPVSLVTSLVLDHRVFTRAELEAGKLATEGFRR